MEHRKSSTPTATDTWLRTVHQSTVHEYSLIAKVRESLTWYFGITTENPIRRWSITLPEQSLKADGRDCCWSSENIIYNLQFCCPTNGVHLNRHCLIVQITWTKLPARTNFAIMNRNLSRQIVHPKYYEQHLLHLMNVLEGLVFALRN